MTSNQEAIQILTVDAIPSFSDLIGEGHLQQIRDLGAMVDRKDEIMVFEGIDEYGWPLIRYIGGMMIPPQKCRGSRKMDEASANHCIGVDVDYLVEKTMGKPHIILVRRGV